MSYLTAIWLLPVAMALHEVEEWNILGWEQRNFANLPAKTNTSVRTFLVFLTLFGFLWTALAAWLNNPKIAAYMILALAAGAFLNTLQHLFYTMYFRQYAPGVITSVVLYLPNWWVLAIHNSLTSQSYAKKPMDPYAIYRL